MPGGANFRKVMVAPDVNYNLPLVWNRAGGGQGNLAQIFFQPGNNEFSHIFGIRILRQQMVRVIQGNKTLRMACGGINTRGIIHTHNLICWSMKNQ